VPLKQSLAADASSFAGYRRLIRFAAAAAHRFQVVDAMQDALDAHMVAMRMRMRKITSSLAVAKSCCAPLFNAHHCLRASAYLSAALSIAEHVDILY
jgi:hypothetical protein